MASNSACRHEYQEALENALNKQINEELKASHVYLAMATYFQQDQVALHGFHKYFMKQSHEEREHAQKMMEYQNLRGGRVVIGAIAEPPARSNWSTPLEALKHALGLERRVNELLRALHAVGTNCNDPQFCDFLESEFLKEQVESIKEISDMITNLTRAGDGLGTYIFDRNLQD